MNIKDNGEEDNTAKPVYQKKTEEIVNFFKSLVNTDPDCYLKVPNEFQIPTTYKEFLTGNFLNSPKFLIQSYFFEYINSVGMHEEFVKAVYELLTEQMPKKYKSKMRITETENRAQEVFGNLFIDEEVLKNQIVAKNINYHYTYLCFLSGLQYEYMNTDFINYIDTPDLAFISPYIPKEGRFDVTRRNSQPFHNSQDFVLLAMFFCFTFDSATKTYKLDHLPNASKDLKDFFAKYKYPVESISFTMQCEWRRVVSDPLGFKYGCSESGSKNSTGILSMLYALSRLVGCTLEIKNAIDYIESFLKKNTMNDWVNLENSIKKVFSSLSRNKEVETNFDDFKSFDNDENMPINGYLILNGIVLYNMGCVWGRIKFRISNCSIYTKVISIRKKRLKETGQFYSETKYFPRVPECLPSILQDVYMNIDTYPKTIINQFFNQSFNNRFNDLLNSFKYNKKAIANRKCDNPNRLMLWGSLDNLEYKSHLVKQFLIRTSGQALKNNDAMVRFTSNLIGSAPLNKLRTRQHILSGCAYNENYKAYYPQLDYDVCTVPKTELSLAGLYPMVEFLLKVKEIKSSAILSSYMSLMDVYRKDTEILYLFSSANMLASIMHEIKLYDKLKCMQWSHCHKFNSISLEDDDGGMADLKLQKYCRIYVLNYFHQKLTDAIASPVDNNLTTFYLC
ncbi:hypothetical protein NEIG_02342 [Nematocida sp. ERTm5]|nr:hypothetical protein NEIG_02342 [Nematocida sp. ERTm5]